MLSRIFNVLDHDSNSYNEPKINIREIGLRQIKEKLKKEKKTVSAWA